LRSSRKQKRSADSKRPFRLAIVAPLPVQYNAPLFQRLAREPDIEAEVLYGTLAHVSKTYDPGFGIEYAWDIPLVEGYRYRKIPTLKETTLDRGLALLSPVLLKELRPSKYDAALIYGWGDWFSRSALAACLLNGLPYLITGDATPVYPDSPLKGALKHVVLSYILRKSAACLYVGTLQRVYFERLGVPSERLFFHPWTVDNERFFKAVALTQEQKNKLRADLGLPMDLPLVAFCGKLIKRKRPLDLLSAVVRLRNEGIESGIVFVGEGELKPLLVAAALREGLSDVYFMGFVNQSQLPNVLAACDVFCLPSEKDPRATVVAEAMATGLPVVISHKVGLWGFGDLVSEGETGLVYYAGDLDGLTDKLRTLITDTKLRRRMAIKALQRMRTWGLEERVAGLKQAVEFLRNKAHDGAASFSLPTEIRHPQTD
jgi:glycosyltransferase involved in cell wall biosynthesis